MAKSGSLSINSENIFPIFQSKSGCTQTMTFFTENW